MDVPEGFSPTLILVLNLAGTFVFGLSGGLAAVRAKLDLFGVVVLAAVVGLAGGITRDLLIGTPPATFRDWRYLAAAAAAGLVCFFAGRVLDRYERSVMVFDALGLGLFAVTGATKALLFGLGPVQAILLGTITGVGGGMLRDVLLRQIPTVLREGLYAIPALLGATVLVVAQEAGSTNPVFPVLGVLVCVGVRLVGLRYDVNVPTAPPKTSDPTANDQGAGSMTATGFPADRVLRGLDTTRRWQEDFYRHLHQHPELSHQEHRTAAAVAERLGSFGFEVHEGVGGTGVVGVLRNGAGPAVLLRADMDALPVREQTGLPYASTVTARDPDGAEVPVMHACGHDVHVTCLLGASALLADARADWHGTVVALFQPAEELGDGARTMVDDGLASVVGSVDVAFGQHVLPMPAGVVGTRPGPALSAGDSMRITVYGRGAHGSMPQASVDPVVLAAMIVVQLQTVIAREVAPTVPAVLTVGSIQAGTKSNVIADRAVLQLNVRTYTEQTRSTILDAIKRIVVAECQASRSPRDPEFELFDRFPPTQNDPATTERVRAAFDALFGDRAQDLPLQTASEDFSDIPNALSVPYTYWGIGGVDPQTYQRAARAGRIAEDIPVNHSPAFAPAIQPTLDTGTQAMVAAALAWLA